MLETPLPPGEGGGRRTPTLDVTLHTIAQTESLSCFIHQFEFKLASADHPPTKVCYGAFYSAAPLRLPRTVPFHLEDSSADPGVEKLSLPQSGFER